MIESEELPPVEATGGQLELVSEKKRPYYFQLDVLKAIAIILVVMDHSLTWEIKESIGSLF